MLLKDDSTRGTRAGGQARVLGYENVERHLVGQQFIELVTHGLVGTVGVSVEELRELVDDRVAAGQGVMLGIERSSETGKARQTRVRKRGATSRTYEHEVVAPQPGASRKQSTRSTAKPNSDILTLF